jgi:DNA polymerase-3 subunit gamma/tau
MYLALARKYRPHLFGELIAQDHVARALRGAVEQQRVAHGYLFAGPRGVGKTTAARILAMALNCETRHAGRATSAPGEPCGTCASCQRIWAGSASLDVVEIDAASNRGVDDARDLRERAMYAASQEGRHKVYIVDEAHMLTRDAWNALLKILEEPPPGVVFVFATTEPQKIANTAAPVMSRLQRFDFRRVGRGAIADRLRAVLAGEGLGADDDAVELIARVADGGMRDALSVLDQAVAFGEGAITAARVREVLGLVGDEVFAELLGLVAERRAADVFGFVERLADAGVDLTAFIDGAGDLLRGLLAARLGGAPGGLSAALAASVAAAAPGFEPGDLLRMLRALEEAEEPIRRGVNARLSVETLLVRWTLMDRTVEIAELLRGEGAGKVPDGTGGSGYPSRAGGGQAPPPRPSVVRDSGARPAAPPSRAEAPRTERAPSGEPGTLDALRAAWTDVVAVAKAEKPLVASALEDAEPVALADGALLLRPLGGNPMTAEGLIRSRAAIENMVARVVGAPVRVGLEASGSPPPGGPAAGPPARAAGEGVTRPASVPEPPDAPRAASSGPGSAPQRVTATGAKAERVKALRQRDPTLGSAIDSLDLELLE